MIKILLTIGMFFYFGLSFAQTHGIKMPIDTIDTYPISFSKYGDSITIDGKPATEKEYDSLVAHVEEIRNCCPCLIRYHSKRDSMIFAELVKCDRYWVGEHKLYDKQGNLKLKGFYEHSSDLIIRDTLSIGLGDPGNKTGEWIYFNTEGDTIMKELWNNGTLIFSSLDDSVCSIWGYSTTIDGVNLNHSTISIDDLAKVQITYFYKSKNQNCKPKIRLELIDGEVSFKSQMIYNVKKSSEWEIEGDSFNFTDFRKLFSSKGEVEFSERIVVLSILTNEDPRKHEPPSTIFKLTE
jgi:hypothetical protein